jgi:hypothetical protein
VQSMRRESIHGRWRPLCDGRMDQPTLLHSPAAPAAAARRLSTLVSCTRSREREEEYSSSRAMPPPHFICSLRGDFGLFNGAHALRSSLGLINEKVQGCLSNYSSPTSSGARPLCSSSYSVATSNHQSYLVFIHHDHIVRFPGSTLNLSRAASSLCILAPLRTRTITKPFSVDPLQHRHMFVMISTFVRPILAAQVCALVHDAFSALANLEHASRF